MLIEKRMHVNANNFFKENSLPNVALSNQQPWAWLIANGHKDIENRNWSTIFRGEFYVHAGQKIDYRGYDYVQYLIKLYKLDIDLPSIPTLQTGGIVGVSYIADCVLSSGSLWFSGPYGFVLRNSRVIPFQKCNGKLKFFSIISPITKQEATLNDKNQKLKAVKKEKHCMTLLVQYTDKEMADLARKFSAVDSERDAIAKRKAAAMIGYKADHDTQQEAIDKIKERIREGGALGTVECESSLDEKSRIIETVRLDTGEIVEGVGHPVMNLKDKKKDVSKNDKEIENLIKWYQKAKEEKDDSSMKKILEDLTKKGIVVEDTKDGVKWYRKEEKDTSVDALIRDFETAKKENNMVVIGKIKKQLELKGYLPEDGKDGVKWVKKPKEEKDNK